MLPYISVARFGYLRTPALRTMLSILTPFCTHPPMRPANAWKCKYFSEKTRNSASLVRRVLTAGVNPYIYALLPRHIALLDQAARWSQL